MPFTSMPGARLYWKLDGRDGAPALVLLNSIGTDMDLWDTLLPRLRERFTVLRVDTRGHGASSAEPGDFSMPLLARDVMAVAHDAGIEHFSLAGVSLGGMIGMELALMRPLQVNRLALICTSATMAPASWNDRATLVRTQGMAAIAELSMGRFFSERFRAAQPAICDAARRQLLTMDAQGYAGCGAAIRDMELSDRIARIACPVLVVTGTHDLSTPFEGHGEYLLEHIPEAVHASLNAAHLPPIEAPHALADILIPFLEG